MPVTPDLAPQIACYITPPHKPTVNYGNKLAYSGGNNQISVTQNFGRQGDTATFDLIDGNYASGEPPNLVVHPTFVIPAFSVVKLIDTAALTYYGDDDRASIFYGYVAHPQLSLNGVSEMDWYLSCVDPGGYANASVVQAVYEGIPMGDAIVDVVRKSNCGVQANTIVNGGFVEKGPTLNRTVIHYTNLTKALQKISKMASSQSAYGWYIDSTMNLHFYDQQQAPDSGVTVTDTPTAAGLLSYTECHMDLNQKITYDFDGSSLYNRALVVGASKTITTTVKEKPLDTFVGDGSTTEFKMSYVPDTTVQSASTAKATKTTLPVVTVNGVQQTITIYDGTTAVTNQWTIQQNPNGSWVLAVTPNFGVTPGAGAKISLWYRYKLTITAQVDLKQSQNAIGGPNRGVFATVVSATSLDSTAAAHQRGARELAEYGHPQEKIQFYTSPEWIGVWRAGMTFILDSQFLLDSQRGFAPGLHAKFMITQQTVTFTQGGFRQWQVTAVRVQ
jgi:hypothetical protein